MERSLYAIERKGSTRSKIASLAFGGLALAFSTLPLSYTLSTSSTAPSPSVQIRSIDEKLYALKGDAWHQLCASYALPYQGKLDLVQKNEIPFFDSLNFGKTPDGKNLAQIAKEAPVYSQSYTLNTQIGDIKSGLLSGALYYLPSRNGKCP